MSKRYLMVSGESLVSQLSNPQVVVADCRFRLGEPNWGYEQYLDSHIPGAYYLNLDHDLSSPITRHGGRHPLPDIDRLSQKLETMGIIFGETLVVAYDDMQFAFAARFWWLLRYLGHENVALLDGGWKGWQQQGYPVSKTLPETCVGHFTPHPQPNWIVDSQGVRASQDNPSVVLIDSRHGDRYRGEFEPIDPVAGHIPGAINSPWKQVSDESGYLLPLTNQQALWQDYTQAEEIIVYCGSGVTACVNLFSLTLAGISGAKLYPGGWSDWCSYLV